MNALTLDFVRRWRWLFLAQFAGTALVWIWHGEQPRSRLHLEMMAAVAMSWELTRGAVRAHLAVPQTRAAIARGIWFSVVAVPVAIHWAAMVLGSSAALLFGLSVESGALLLHALLSPLLAGTVFYLVSYSLAYAARTLAGQIRDAVFSILWGPAALATLWVGRVAPLSWDAIGPREALVMLVMAAASVASWFTVRGIVENRCCARPGPASALRPLDSAALAPASPLEAWLGMEMRSQGLLSGLAMIFGLFTLAVEKPPDGPVDGAGIPAQQLTIVFVLVLVSAVVSLAGTLRVVRTLPVGLTTLATVTALRPVISLLNAVLILAIANALLRQRFPSDPGGLPVILLASSLVSLAQAVALIWPRALLLLAIVILPQIAMHLPSPVTARPEALLSVAAALMLVSVFLHRDALRHNSSLFRWNSFFSRLAAARRS